MFGLTFLLLISLLVSALVNNPTPAQCYNFLSDATDTLDECGSGPPLTPINGNGASPYCDASGCINQLNSSFQGSFPTGVVVPWTLTFWSVMYLNFQTIVNIRSTGPILTHLELRKQNSKLQLSRVAGTTYLALSQADWGERVWVFVFAASNPTYTIFGATVDFAFETMTAFLATDISGATQISLGNNFNGNEPLHLLRRFNIYSSFISGISALTATFSGLNCLDFLIYPFCSEMYVHYIMEPSYVSGQTILDSSPSGYHATNGIDGTTSSDASISINGLYFDGSSRVTLSPISPISSFTFSLSMWMFIHSSHYSSSQLLFRTSDNKFKISIVPASSIIQVQLNSNSFSPKTFTLMNPAWSLLSVSLSLIDSSSSFCVIGFNGHLQSGSLSASVPAISGFTIGQSFYGYLRDFRFYKTYMGDRTFSSPANRQFYDTTSSSCTACHSSCLNCVNAANTQCGACASGFQLENPGIPGPCYSNACHDSCLACSGPQHNECDTCRSPFFPNFSSGSGECISSCSQVSSDLELVSGSCQHRVIRVALSETIFNEDSNEILLHFSQPLYFNHISASDFTLSSDKLQLVFQDYQYEPEYSFKAKLNPLESFGAPQTVSISLSSRNLATTSSHHALYSSYILDPITLSPQLNPSSWLLAIVNRAGLVTEGVSIIILVALVISQSFFQISFQMLWALLNFNQLVFFAPFLNLSFPSLFFLVLRPLRFSVGDLQLLVMLFDFLFSDLLSSLPSQPFSHNFFLHDFPTMDLVTNCGPLFLLLVIQLFFLLIYFLLSCKFLQRSYCIYKTRNCCSGLKWSSFIRTFLQGMLEQILFSFLNIYLVLGFSHTLPSLDFPLIFSLSLSCFIILALILFTFGIFRILAREPVQIGTYSSPTYRIYGELYKNQNYSQGFFAKHYQVWFILRRLLLVFSILLISNGMLQLALAQALCVIEIIVLLKLKPFKYKADSAVSVICEFCLLGMYGTLGAMQFVKWSLQIKLVWVCVALVLLGSTVSFFILVKEKIIDCKKERKRRKELIELKERVQKRDQSSILAIIHPFSRNCSRIKSSFHSCMSSNKQTEASLFRPRKAYGEQSSRLGEVEVRWKLSEPDRDTKLCQL